MHVREAIRKAIVEILDYDDKRNWDLVLGQRIQPSRPIKKSIIVYISDEVLTTLVIHPMPCYQRDIQVTVEGRIALSRSQMQTVEDKIDDFQEEIEQRMTKQNIDPIVSNVKQFILDSVETDFDTDDPDRSYMLVALNYNVIVNTNDGDPSNLI